VFLESFRLDLFERLEVILYPPARRGQVRLSGTVARAGFGHRFLHRKSGEGVPGTVHCEDEDLSRCGPEVARVLYERFGEAYFLKSCLAFSRYAMSCSSLTFGSLIFFITRSTAC